ncbi:SlyX family protein [Sagittula sp. M10.9X]|uniref:SlyX family protein n=1 Tax=Sagittula salina TaxID=2820268 RepID=A0A940MLU9_9RHOB|nr:SlyX family protein [Sagittula salina]
MQLLEERAAHLLAAVEDLSDIVARQDGELRALTRRVDILVRREAEREADAPGGVIVGDERPPHY